MSVWAVNRKGEQITISEFSNFALQETCVRNLLATIDPPWHLKCSLRDHQIIPYIEEPQIADSEIQFGGSSDFGFHKPSRIFDLPASRSESLTTGFGIRSVSIAGQKGHRKNTFVP